MDVGGWLRNLGLGQYEQAFRANAVDADVLPKLTADDLKELGVLAIGDRRKLLEALATLSTTSAAPGRPPTMQPEAPGERRQVTVLFADLAGYTALSRTLDAEEVHALLERFFARADHIVAEHGGRVDKHIGDCVMAVFGAPLAHGNDVERAVRAALAIRASMPGLADEVQRPILAHIGVAGGQVVASATGSSTHREYTVTGDTVNLAARLTDAATPGEILVSESVHRALTDRLDCDAVGALAAKGFADPVRAWRLHGLRDPPRSAHRPLVGRAAELGQFRAVLAACAESGLGRTVIVRGEAGIGKTRLIEELQEAAEADGFSCHDGLVLDFGAGTGRDAIRALARDLLTVDAAGGPDAAQAVAVAAVAQGFVDATDAVFVNDLLDVPQPPELRGLYDAMDNASRNRGKRAAMARLVTTASQRARRLLVVEDVHWADQLTLAHLAQLATTVATCPAVLVLTTRIEGDPLNHIWRAELGGSPLLTIDLSPLNAIAARALAEPLRLLSKALAERCVERAAGNPLFLVQLLRHAEEGVDAAVPDSIQSLVQARLDRLDPSDKAALQVASVLGQRFDANVLRYALERPDYVPDGLVAQLLVRPQAQGYLFAHALIRDAVYSSLLRGRRQDLHRRLAVWFAERDPVLHAEHLDRAEDPDAPRAYLDAARAQAREHRYESASRLSGRGLELATEPADQSALALFAGDILHDLGVMSEARGAYERVLLVATDEFERCRAWIGLAAVKRVIDDIDGAFADLERAEAVAVERGFVAEAARVHSARGNLCFPRGDIPGCVREHGRALELARQIRAPELEAAALGGLGDAEYMRGRMLSAHARLSECVELSRQHGLGRIEVANLAQVAHTMVYFRPQQEAAERALAAAQAAARVGHLRADLNASVAAVFAFFNLAEAVPCLEQVTRCQALVRRLGAWRFEASCLRYRGRVALSQGLRDEAIEFLRQATDLSRRTGITFEGPRTLSALALALPDPAERRALLAEGEALIGAGCVGHNPPYFYPDAIDICLEQGDLAEVERYATALEDFTRPEPLPWADFHIARARVLAAHRRGDRGEAIDRELERLAATAEATGLVFARRALEAVLPRGTRPGR